MAPGCSHVSSDLNISFKPAAEKKCMLEDSLKTIKNCKERPANKPRGNF